MRDPRYDILFERVALGPLTARNRFYQVPHCNGLGYRDPSALAAMRGVKAEGGWAVVCTEQAEIHYSSDITPFIELRLWDDRDIPALARMADAVHEHGALAGIELAYNGMNGPNHYGREVPMGPAALPVATFSHEPVQARRMNKADIANLRRWHLAAVRRAKAAGFDLIYVYAAHSLSFLSHFLSRRFNDRTDEYGGSIENRVRLLREVTEDARNAVGASCAVPIRISIDDLTDEGGLKRAEVEDMIGCMADLPDLWDVTLAGWENDSRTSRFAEEGHEEEFIRGRQAPDDQAGGGRRPLYLGRPHGEPGARRRARSHRRRSSFDRRPVPAQEDRGGAHRGHPRVHRLQHLRRPATLLSRRFAAPRIRPWPRNGAEAGTLNGLHPRAPRAPCWWSAADPRASRPRTCSASAGIP